MSPSEIGVPRDAHFNQKAMQLSLTVNTKTFDGNIYERAFDISWRISINQDSRFDSATVDQKRALLLLRAPGQLLYRSRYTRVSRTPLTHVCLER